MRQGNIAQMRQAMTTTAMALMLAGSGTAIARAQGQPADILPHSAATPAASSSQPAASPTSPAVPSAASQPAAPTIAAQPVVTPEPVREPVMAWSLGDAQALLSFIGQIEGEGLIPTDYRPDELRAAIAGVHDGLRCFAKFAHFASSICRPISAAARVIARRSAAHASPAVSWCHTVISSGTV